MKARDFQAKLLAEPDIVDAVPEGGQVRLVSQASSGRSQPRKFDGVAAQPTPARFEDGFMVLLEQAGGAKASQREEAHLPDEPSAVGNRNDSVVEVHDLDRRFGKFVAVDHVSFSVKRGEIFGLLGPNGAGKTTTFRMLCGLLPATGGHLEGCGNRCAPEPSLGPAAFGLRGAEVFALWATDGRLRTWTSSRAPMALAARKNASGSPGASSQFNLEPFVLLPSAQLPGGFKQRLAMAAALLHRPEILFLDEPTSGADPFARREFWQRITALATNGVTVIVTTHFMAEAEYCDRAAILDNGKVLAQGTPAELRARAPAKPGRTATMEDAFVAIVLEARGQAGG